MLFRSLRKLEQEDYSGTVLALAGIIRLGLENAVSKVLSTEEMIPAAGQGILAVQGRTGEDYSFLDEFLSNESAVVSSCERAFVTALNGGCTSPIAGYAQISGNEIELRGLYCEEESEEVRIGTIHGDCKDAVKLGETLANRLKKNEWR